MAIISFIGDIGLNDDYVRLTNRNNNPFRYLIPTLSASDLVVGNLECVLKGDQGENLLKRPRLSTTINALQYIESFNLGLASLATNHAYDNLEDGFRKTIDFLDKKNISYLGAGMNRKEAKRAFTCSVNNLSFCFLNYITVDTNPSLPDNAGISLNEFALESCLTDLQNASGFDYRILLMHWGGRFEGGLYPDLNQVSLARKLIDNGADLIIGHHSHTLQPFEQYKGKYIFYSLGNFCFSDIRFEGKIRKMSSLRERESVIVTVDFKKPGYAFKLIPFRNEKLILQPRKLVKTKLVFRNTCWQIIKHKPFWLVYQFYFHKIRPVIVQLIRKDEKRNLFQRIYLYLRQKSNS